MFFIIYKCVTYTAQNIFSALSFTDSHDWSHDWSHDVIHIWTESFYNFRTVSSIRHFWISRFSFVRHLVIPIPVYYEELFLALLQNSHHNSYPSHEKEPQRSMSNEGLGWEEQIMSDYRQVRFLKLRKKNRKILLNDSRIRPIVFSSGISSAGMRPIWNSTLW